MGMQGLDGVSQWANLLNPTLPSPRDEMVYNLDEDLFPLQGKAAIRVGDWKLVDGYPGLYPDWYEPGEYPDIDFDEPPLPHDTATLKVLSKRLKMDDEPLWRYLFNLKDDPNETTNLYDEKHDEVKFLKQRLEFHKKRMIKAH